MNYIKEEEIQDFVRLSLKEDIGRRDITTNVLIDKNKMVAAVLLAKESFIVCGLGVAALAFRLQDKNIKFKSLVKEGEFVRKEKVLARISGEARSILTAERTALNFLTFLSGISTKTRKFAQAVRPYKTKIMDTRKTIPGLRLLSKYAVRIGGGYNHRLRLDEMVLIKDNHLKVTEGYGRLRKVTEGYPFELEVKNFKEFKQALKLKPNIIMLDNMSIRDMKKAVQIRNALSPNTYHLTPKLEASGGITLKNIKEVASTGVEMISVGALTHSVDSVDISLEII
ncbi:MAG: carboxylating nicotinate-nucleotide diphosphorylase [Candidatus Omnitrophica bacterium]|nr:carboxylating nicotinate-nucleotide diphosphorylase [Candidatus Omnitrophota bacterium]